MPEMGEYVVGAYLTHEKQCNGVLYNLPVPGWKHGELDVLGLHLDTMRAYLCEVTTHVQGLIIGRSIDQTFEKLLNKHRWQQDYAKIHLRQFDVQFMLWSPIVGPKLTALLQEIPNLELIINEKYTDCILALQRHAAKNQSKTPNEFFRALQILACLR